MTTQEKRMNELAELVTTFTEAEIDQRIGHLDRQRYWNHDEHTAAENAHMWEALETAAILSLTEERCKSWLDFMTRTSWLFLPTTKGLGEYQNNSK